LPSWIGGSERSTHELCVALQRRGVAVAVVAQARRDAPEVKSAVANQWGTVDGIMGYPVYRVPDVVACVAEIASSLAAAMVIPQNVFALATASVAAGFPTLLFLRHTDFAWLFPGARTPQAAELTHPLLGFLANSEFTRGFYERHLGIRARVVSSIVDPGSYRTTSARQKVVFVNPVPVKGVDIALRLAAARPDIPFEFVEAWPLSDEEYSAVAKRCQPLSNVTLRRAVSDMREVYERAKILLVPSLWQEAWARVVAEVQASGIPVLASTRGGLPASVGPGGLLVDPDADFSHWLTALSRLWDDDISYAGYCAAALAHQARAEIRPDRIIDGFVDAIKCHSRLTRRANGFSVIVPTCRRPERLDILLQRLRDQVAGRADRQLIVVNDGTHDDRYAAVIERNRDIVEYVIAPKNGGPAAARNLGAAHADRTFLVFIDDDCVPPAYWLDWLDGIVAENSDVDVVCGTTQPLISQRARLFARFLAEAGCHPLPYLLEGAAVPVTANLAVRRSVFERVGGFDEAMLTTEDRNLGYRLWLHRAVFRLDLSWFVYHDMTSSLGAHVRRYYRYGQWLRREMALEKAPVDRSMWPPDRRSLLYWPKRALAHAARMRAESGRPAHRWPVDMLFTTLGVLTRLSLDIGFARGPPSIGHEDNRRTTRIRADGRQLADKFLIFALSRTGSTTLMRALECHPAIRCRHEPFSPDRAASDTSAVVQTVDELHQALELIARDHNGIKHVWNAMGWPPFEGDTRLHFELLTSFGRVLLLRRSNILRRIVSSEIARQTLIYQSATPAHDYRTSLRWFPFRRLDDRRIETELAREEQVLCEAKARLADAGVPCLELVYEQFFAPGDRADRLWRIKSVFRFLGLKSTDLGADGEREIDSLLDPAQSKLNDEALLWRIPGIAEIEARFGSNTTGWLFR